MNAFWSGTDDANENMNQFYLVWGKITSEKPEFKLRYCFRNKKYAIDDIPYELFTWPVVTKKTIVKEEVKISTFSELSIEGDMSDVIEGQTNESLMADVNTNSATTDGTESEPLVEVKEEEKETIVTAIYPGPFKMVDVPTDWMGQHTKSGVVTPASSYSRGTYGQSWGGYTAPKSQTRGGIGGFDVEKDFELVVWDNKKQSYVTAEGK